MDGPRSASVPSGNGKALTGAEPGSALATSRDWVRWSGLTEAVGGSRLSTGVDAMDRSAVRTLLPVLVRGDAQTVVADRKPPDVIRTVPPSRV